MSKLSFRARQLDAYKAMPIYRVEEIPEVADAAAINRAVPQMPTGMEKEEETEHHLQRALSAQQVYGTAEALVIPVPDIEEIEEDYDALYTAEYKNPKQYIHLQALGVDQEIPDYDMDSEDEHWLGEQAKKMEIRQNQFEEMMDRLEKGSGQQVVTLQEAKMLLKEDDDLIIAVYDYWLNKRLRYSYHSLIPTVKTEKRDGSTTNNPYVAFRRRTEKMQTRKNRKNDEASYEKMLKLRRDLARAVTLLEMIKKREKCKKELLQLTIEILDKRYEMEDFSGNHFAYAESQKLQRPVFFPLYEHYNKQDTADTTTKRQKYKKRKHKSGSLASPAAQQQQQQQQTGEVDVLEYASTEEEPRSPAPSHSDQEEEDHPDGIYAFRRKKLCNYHAPLEVPGNWPWCGREERGLSDRKYRFTLTSAHIGDRLRCIGFARRRVGRGGRVMLDRALDEEKANFWDKMLESSLLDNKHKDRTITFREYIKEQKWLHFAPIEEYDSAHALFDGALVDVSSNSPDLCDPYDSVVNIVPESNGVMNSKGFSPLVIAPVTPQTEPIQCLIADRLPSTSLSHSNHPEQLEASFEVHQRELLALKKTQQERLSRQQSVASVQSELDSSQSLAHSFGSQPTSKFLVDSKKAIFAISALENRGHCASNGTSPSTTIKGNGIKQLNGPTPKELKQHYEVLSTSPAANVRKLNFPLTPSSDNNDLAGNSDILHLSSLPGDCGDSLDTKAALLGAEMDFSDSLSNIPEVGSTMEVS